MSIAIANNGCQYFDDACQCRNAHLDTGAACIQEGCSDTDAAQTYGSIRSFCYAQGVEVLVPSVSGSISIATKTATAVEMSNVASVTALSVSTSTGTATNPALDSPSTSSPSSAAANSSHSHHLSTGAIAGIAIGITVLAILVAVAGWIIYRQRQKIRSMWMYTSTPIVEKPAVNDENDGAVITTEVTKYFEMEGNGGRQ